jgi:hypothetical protein
MHYFARVATAVAAVAFSIVLAVHVVSWISNDFNVVLLPRLRADRGHGVEKKNKSYHYNVSLVATTTTTKVSIPDSSNREAMATVTTTTSTTTAPPTSTTTTVPHNNVSVGFQVPLRADRAHVEKEEKCGRHSPMKTPKVCLFFFTALRNEAYRNRTLAVAHTWATSARNLSQATDAIFSMHFHVDPKYRDFVESVLPSSEIIWWEEGEAGSAAAMLYKRLNKLNSSLQQLNTSCDWVIVPEDDSYMNWPLVTSKLACLDSAGPPRLMGSIWASVEVPFVHGSVWVMNAAAVPVLLQVARKQHLAQRSGFGDVAVAQCLLDEYALHRPQAFPFLTFGCHIIVNTESGPLNDIEAHPEPECLDWFHKVLPHSMAKVHEIVFRRPCRRSLANRMELCVFKESDEPSANGSHVLELPIH